MNKARVFILIKTKEPISFLDILVLAKIPKTFF